jgi:Fic-DOC domain mobile mystery protein B
MTAGSSPFQSDPDQTPLDESEKRDLIPSIFTRTELNAHERENINSAREWVMSARVLRVKDLLSDHFLKELHRKMFSDVWSWAGSYRTTVRNLGWEPYRISVGVRTSLDDARFWFNQGTYPPAEAAVRLHHQLVVIHPWANGNGRHARLVADCLVAKAGAKPLRWGGTPELLLGAGNLRQTYLEAMRSADQLDFAPLLKFCC